MRGSLMVNLEEEHIMYQTNSPTLLQDEAVGKTLLLRNRHSRFIQIKRHPILRVTERKAERFIRIIFIISEDGDCNCL